MHLKNLIVNYADFNLWANKTITAWLKTKPEDLLVKEVPSSYPTLLTTCMHIWDAERFWLSFLQTSTPPKIFTHHFEGPTHEALNGVVNHSEGFANYVHSLSEADLLQEYSLYTAWMKGRLPQYEYMQHCFNHSTYHRGQLVTMGRMVGFIDPPGTDYNFYNMKVMRKNN